MKLALLTPWPTQPSGIADYAFDLAAGLDEAGLGVTVYTDLATGDALRSSGLTVRSHRRFPGEAAQFNCKVFQMGNNPLYHAWMLPLIRQYGGVVHLHDLVLQHLLASLTIGKGKVTEYLEMTERWYGDGVRESVHKMLACKSPPWETALATDLPLFEEVVQHADACIVHSEFAWQRIIAAFPNKEVLCIPQIYRLSRPAANPLHPQSVRVGIFGGVQPNRQVEAALEALAIASKGSERKVDLVVVGEIAKTSRNIPGLAKRLRHARFEASFTGRVSENEFHGLLADCDLLIALRYPTMGETSAVVTKALQFGIPCIVTRTGWYAELPDIVRKIEQENMPGALRELLGELFEAPARLSEWKIACVHHADRAFSFDQSIRNYRETLLHTAGRDLVERQLAQAMMRTRLGNADAALLGGVVAKAREFLEY